MIPYRMNPMGISNNRSILGYAPNAEAFWDGLNNIALGTFDQNAIGWKDLTNNGYDLVKLDSSKSILWSANGGIQGNYNASFICPLTVNKCPYDSTAFTIELAYYVPENLSSLNAWWINNRYPWNSGSGIQIDTYSGHAIGIQEMHSLNSASLSDMRPYRTVHFVYQNGIVSIYADGTFIESTSFIAGAGDLSNIPLFVNGTAITSLSLNQPSCRFFGCRVYKRALSAAELANNSDLDISRFNV